jgi:hypothetical protein
MKKKKLIEYIGLLREWGKKENSNYGKYSYYYLINKPFGLVDKEMLEIGDERKKYGYFEMCMQTENMSYAWYLATAYHWVAQLGFCHKFIHNRVSYITGATGAGKTTEIPKLYMYYLKALDYNDNGTVVVTVPRQNVASSISLFVSKCLVLPIEAYKSDDAKETKPETKYNYNIQYKYKTKRHVPDEYVYFPKIKFITDGSVVKDMTDPTMKNKSCKNDVCVYFDTNKYDVIIVDEAHEHNKNMDLILSYAKNAVYYNNNVRLVIMSATIDNDEPKYRRFYRDINDNRKYPPDKWLSHHKLDRINTDRRFHISAPEQTTKYTINDHYRPMTSAVEMVLEITQNTSTGDILLFHAGTGEITKSVKELNEKMPQNVIALPYHAKLSRTYKPFIENIANNKDKIKWDRKKNEVRGITTDKDIQKGSKYYNRVVIVSTNIAEASITISSLKYVVESGTEKYLNYDYEKRSSILKDAYITEASRLQRRGRIGRTSSGDAYYLYEKNSLLNNKKQFNISTDDLHQDVMLEYMYNGDDNKFPIILDIINEIVGGYGKGYKTHSKIKLQNILRNAYIKHLKSNKFTDDDINNNIDDEIKAGDNDIVKQKKKVKQYMDKVDSIIKIILSQYTIGDNLYTYIGNYSQYDYKNDKQPPLIYDSGYKINELVDPRGLFYFIHPDELVIKRNISGHIVDTLNDSVKLEIYKNSPYKKLMVSYKMISFWETLFNSGYIEKKNNKFYKTESGLLLSVFARKLSVGIENPYLIKCLFYYYGLSDTETEFNNIIDVLSFLEVLPNGDINNLLNINNEEKRFASDLHPIVKVVFGGYEKKSDIYIIANICKYINKVFIDNKIILDIFEYIQTSENKKDVDVYKDNTGERRDILTKAMESYDNEYINNKMKNNLDLKHMIKKTGLNITIVGQYLKKRVSVKKIWSDIKNNIKDTDNENETMIDLNKIKLLLEEYKKYIRINNIDTLKATLMLCYPFNIVKKINNSKISYISAYIPKVETIVSAKQIYQGPYKPQLPESFIDSIYLHDYILYLNEDINNRSISMLTHITKNDLLLISNIYNKKVINRNILKFNSNTISIDKYMINYIENGGIVNNNSEHITAINNIYNTITTISNDIKYINYYGLWVLLAKLRKGTGYIDYIKVIRGIIINIQKN